MVQSIDEQLNTITQDVADTYTALGAKGATLPTKKGTSNLKATVDSLPKGGFPNKLYNVDANGTVTALSDTFNEDTFKGIVKVESGFDFFFYSQDKEGYICFPDLETISGKAFTNADNSDSSIGLSSWSKRYVSVNSFPKLRVVSNSYAMSGWLLNVKTGIDFKELKIFRGDFKINNFVTEPFYIKMDKLTEAGSMWYLFGYSPITEFSCNSLVTAESNSFGRTFSNCKSLTKVSFASLNRMLDDSFQYTFSYCTSLQSIDFSGVQKLYLYGTFFGCSSLKTLSFPKATNIKLYATPFSGCTALTEIHFRADMQATVEALPDYASKWGATNATIYFDL